MSKKELTEKEKEALKKALKDKQEVKIVRK